MHFKKQNKTVSILILTVVFLISCSTNNSLKQEKKLFNDIQSKFEGFDLLKHSSKTIGHRLTGSKNGAQAEEMVYNKLLDYGLNVKYQEFQTNAWSRDTVSIILISKKDSLKLKAVSLAYSPEYANIESQLIDVGDGLVKDFDSVGVKLAGKIALVNLYPLNTSSNQEKNLHRTEKTSLAIDNGAVGLIFVNKPTGGVLLTGTASITGDVLPIPAICIDRESGNLIRSKYLNKKNGFTVKIFTKNKVSSIKARNVLATIPGKKKETIIIGGHLDSWDLSTGAIDNGIGAFAILDIARAMAKLNFEPKYTVVFAFWMGEEQGLLGSTHFVNELKTNGELEDVKLYINIDMSGNPKGFDIQGRKDLEKTILNFGSLIAKLDTTFANELASNIGLHSDHQPFILEGIPALQPNGNLDKGVYKFYHSNSDNIKLVNEKHMKNTSVRMGLLLYQLAMSEELSFKRLNSEETKQFFVDAGLKEKMTIAGDWKWD
jgi:carboxypeptidase Q